MATITRFEDIKAWQEARKLVVDVYALTYKAELGKDYALRDQMRRAAISVPSNIAEGFERSGNKEFRQFLSHSKGSCGELRSQLYNALDLGYCTDIEFSSLQRTAEGISKMISGFSAYLQQAPVRGQKFKS
jgi:four helix bundle protein